MLTLAAWLAPGWLRAEPAGNPRVAMPYLCAMERGRLRVEPAPLQIYELAGPRETQPFQACAGPQGGRCRSWTLHRFQVQCGSDRVSWVEVVAAALALRPGILTELEGDRLILSRRRARDLRFVRSCYDRLSGATGRPRIYDPALVDECWSLQRRVPGARVALPPGFAPTAMIGARFLPPARTAVATASPPALPATGASEPRGPAGRDAAAPAPMAAWRTHLALPLPSAEIPSPAPISVATASAPATPADTGAPWSPWTWLILPTLAALAALSAYVVHRGAWRPAADWLAALMQIALPGASRADERMAGELRIAARERLAATLETINRLPPVMPLRQVLARELHVAGQRLEALCAEEPKRAGQWRRVRVRLQTVTRELQRLAAIAEGAHSSLGTGGMPAVASVAEPRDKVEAYALLGVNPDVNERILKKLVEALRQSWHPDQARDDDDRRRREDRIKQINVAWDLIQGKRVEA